MTALSPAPRLAPRYSVPLATLVLTLITVGCGAPKPTRMELDPPEVMKFYKKDQQSSIRVAVYDERDKPLIKLPPLTFKSSDETTAKVDDKGVVTSTGSGVAKITVSTEGVEKSLNVEVAIVGGVEFAKDMEAVHKADPNNRMPIKIIVKDDKGNPMTQHPPVRYDATSACLDVYQDGTWVPYQKGECSILAKVGGFEASFRVTVK